METGALTWDIKGNLLDNPAYNKGTIRILSSWCNRPCRDPGSASHWQQHPPAHKSRRLLLPHWYGRQTKILRSDWIRISRTCQGCAYLTFCQAGIDGDFYRLGRRAQGCRQSGVTKVGGYCERWPRESRCGQGSRIGPVGPQRGWKE